MCKCNKDFGIPGMHYAWCEELQVVLRKYPEKVEIYDRRIPHGPLFTHEDCDHAGKFGDFTGASNEDR